MFQIPDHVRPVRDRVLRFVDEHVIPHERGLDRPWAESVTLLTELRERAKAEGLWALGHPAEIGGGGMAMRDYLFVNEAVGRTEPGQAVFGTNTLQTALLLHKHASPATRADLVDGEWVVTGRKWFTSWVDRSSHVLVMCRTEPEHVPVHQAFSMIVVPTSSPGFTVVRDLPVLGLHDVLSGHFELAFDQVRVPADALLGPRGAGFTLSQERLGPGRIYHCMRWLGQAQRAFDLLCRRANDRHTGGRPLADRQLVQKMVFDSYLQIQSARLMVLHTAELVDRGDQARVEISAIKVQCAQMVHDVVDRAMQIYGGEGMTNDLPLESMYRHARYGRIVDGPDEVHVQRVARSISRSYAGDTPTGWDFATR